jgi:hypothetical protein
MQERGDFKMKASKKSLLTLSIVGAIGISIGSAYAQQWWSPQPGDQASDWQTHYVCYEVKPPVYQNQKTEVTVYNQFTYAEGEKLYIGDAKYLCVPTKKAVPTPQY